MARLPTAQQAFDSSGAPGAVREQTTPWFETTPWFAREHPTPWFAHHPMKPLRQKAPDAARGPPRQSHPQLCRAANSHQNSPAAPDAAREP